MTDEAYGGTPDEAPVPPASTRWSEDAVPDDTSPAPPFVPGRGSTPAPTPGAAPTGADRGAPETQVQEAAVQEIETEPSERPGPAEDEPFPFELPMEEEVGEAPDTAGELTAAEDDFPFERFDIEGRGSEAATEAPPTEALPTEPAEPEEEGEPAVWTPTEHLGPAGADVGAGSTAEAAEEVPEAGGEASEAVQDVAALLDRMAMALRSEGEAAVRREMDSPDRMTALLAGLLAGYLSGRS